MNNTSQCKQPAMAPGHDHLLSPGNNTGTSPQSTAKSMLLTLTLDLGTSTGWALLAGSSVIASGTEILASDAELQQQRKEGNERTYDLRFDRLLVFITGHIATGIQRIIFEDVQFIRSPCQSQLWASLRTAIWAATRGTNIGVFCVSVSTLKLFATGNGSADKIGMACALGDAEPMRYRFVEATGRIQNNGIEIDDNEVDAIWLARFTIAVDRGEQRFLSSQQRKRLGMAATRARRRAVRAANKARKQLRDREMKARARAFRAAVKAMGRCCGVYRKPSSRGWATCPKCGLAARVLMKQDGVVQPTG